MRARLYCMQYICVLHYTAIYCTFAVCVRRVRLKLCALHSIWQHTANIFAVCVRRVRRRKLCALHSILQYRATRICSILQHMRVCSICALSYATCPPYAMRVA